MTRDRVPLLLSFLNGRAFLEHYWVKSDEAGLFVPGRPLLDIAERVELEIVFVEPKMAFHSRGVVRWRRPTGSAALPPGIGLAFPLEERETHDVILNFVHGTSQRELVDRDPRLPAALGVRCVADGRVHIARTENVSTGGVFIASRTAPERGVLVSLHLDTLDRSDRVDVDGVVVWRRPTGLIPGFGVRFLIRDEAVRHAVRDLVDSLRQRQLAQQPWPGTSEDV